MAGLSDLTKPEAVTAAIEEFDALGESQFLSRYGFGPARDYFLIVSGRPYPSKAIAGVAYGKQHPSRGHLPAAAFSGGEETVATKLRELGFEVRGPSSSSTVDPETERARRLAMWTELANQPDPQRIPPAQLRELGIFGGAQGIWVDKATTGQVRGAPAGVTVALLHTGRHYEDDLADDGIIYHYPSTARGPTRDAGEVEATKNAQRLRLPVFVVAPGATASTRTVHLAWIDDWDDELRQFLISFDYGQNAPEPLPDAAQIDGLPFELTEDATALTLRLQRARPNQRRFKFALNRYYGGGCAVCSVSADGLIDAAHLCPKSDGGGDDPRNGLLLCATHHRALDRKLFAIDPGDLTLHAKPESPTLADLGITAPDLSHLPRKPHRDALEHVWLRFSGSFT